MKPLTILNSLSLIAVIVLLFMGQCGDNPTPVTNTDTIIQRIENRDTLLIERDTVVYRYLEVKNLITEYRTETDTVLKLQLCDSMAVKCDSLASQFNRQDSIYREQIVDYKLLVAVKDSLLKVKPKRRWIVLPVPIPIRRR